MSLEELPHDVLRIILNMLDTPSVVCMASSCKSLSYLCQDLPLDIRMAYKKGANFVRFLNKHASKIRTLISKGYFSHGFASAGMWHYPMLPSFQTLETLKLTCSRVSPCITRDLPVSLKHLECAFGVEPYSMFRTKRLDRLFRLETVRLTFCNDYDLVMLDSIRPLQELAILRAPMVLVRTSPKARKLHIHVTEHLGNDDRFEDCDELRISITHRHFLPTLDHMMPHAARILSIKCPGRIITPRLPKGIEHFRFWFDSIVFDLDDLRETHTLQSFELHSKYVVAITGTFPVPPHVQAVATISGDSLPDTVFRAIPLPHQLH